MLRGLKAIYTREMISLFRSPLAWTMLGMFALIGGFYYSVDLSMYSSIISLEIKFMSGLLFVIIPVITMRAFAGERREGTDVLLFTAPVSLTAVVLGKFLSTLTLFGAMVATTFVHLLSTVLLGGTVDKITFYCYVLFILMGMAYIAIASFISAQTGSQTIAAMVSTLVFLAFNLLNTMAPSIGHFITGLLGRIDFLGLLQASDRLAAGNFITSLLQWLNPASRISGAAEGALQLSGLVYLLSLSVLFIFFTVRALDAARRRG